MKKVLPLAAACAAAAAVLSSSGGCAKTPDVPLGEGSKRLVVRFRLRGGVREPGAAVPAWYFVVLNRTPNAAGPAPVARVTRPWGNGFVASNQNGQVGYIGTVAYKSDQSLGNTGYQVYAVQTQSGNTNEPVANPDNFPTFPSNFVALGQPDVATPPQTGDRELAFELNLSRLPRRSLTDYPFLQLNIIATDNLPADTVNDVYKDWDALGDGRSSSTVNSYVIIDLRSNTIYRPGQGSNPEEPEGDVRDRDSPSTVALDDLDIVDYSIEVRTQQ
jgi:hypothetical protein